MKIASTEELSDSDFITCIKTDNKTFPSWKFQEYHIEGLEQCGIKKAGIKQAQTQVQQVK